MSDMCLSQDLIRELKQWQQQPWGQHIVNIDLNLTLGFCNFLNLFSVPIGLRTCSNQIYNARVQVQIKIHSPKYTARIHFTLLLCKGWQRNVHRFTCIMHMNNHCVTHKTFCLVAMLLSFPLWLACYESHPSCSKWKFSQLFSYEIKSFVQKVLMFLI